MSFATGFRGTAQGSVQSNYTDQPGVAVPGMVAFASDLNMIDAYFVGDDNGIGCGLGVKLAQNTAAAYNLQAPDQAAFLPADAGETVASFAGVLVFDESAQCDESGIPGYPKGRVARVLRPGRSGGRIWVKTPAAGVITDKVWWTIAASAGHALGEFTAADLGNGDSVDLSTVAKWVTPAVAGGLAMIELF